MDRREFLRISGGAAILGIGFTATGRSPAWAQGATALTDLGLPEVTITLAHGQFQVSPAEATPGWTLITFDNQQPAGDFNSADLMLLPPGETIESFMAVVATPTAATPAWIYQTSFAGAPSAVAGESVQAVVRLTAGNWAVFSPDPVTLASLTVTEGDGDGTPAAPPALTADLDVAMPEFAFVGLEQPVPAGPHVWQVTNSGEQPHFMVLLHLPDGTTQAQLMGGVTTMMTGTPVADAIDFERAQPVGGCSTLSPGQALYLALDLAAGTYGAVCFFPDEQTGAPHVMLGMAAVFVVE